MKKKSKILKIVIFCICFLGFFAMQFLMTAGTRLGLQAYSGVFMAIQFAFCILLVWFDHKKGLRMAIALSALSLVMAVRAITTSHTLNSLPGVCNGLIYIIVLFLLGNEFWNREQQAITDPLTGLQNRRGLYDMIQQRIEKKVPFHVLYIDLGDFKVINDNYGHNYGDLVLKMVVGKLLECIGKYGTVCRMESDEFVVLLDGNRDPDAMAYLILKKIAERTTIHYETAQIDCYLSGCVGIAEYPTDGTDWNMLLRCADIAMARAQKEIRSGVCHYRDGMDHELNRVVEIEKLLKEGFDNDNFYLDYQPQYDINSRKLRGFEALLRLKGPEGISVDPMDFISIAEQGEMILQIDEYVLNRAMREFREYLVHNREQLILSINISSKDIGTPDFVKKVRYLLSKNDFPPESLELEITEYCLLHSIEVTSENIRKLRELGVHVALDDFGAGSTSLSYLSELPISVLKIDKRMIDGIESDETRRKFAATVVELGHLTGCKVIAEGVEKEEQVEILKAQQCDFVQGFVWNRPLHYDDACKLVCERD